MKIAVAQTRPVAGDVEHNLVIHRKLIASAVSEGADIVVFPELSATGYEPKLADTLATDHDDSRFDTFQTISDTSDVTIAIGAPTRNQGGVSISLIIFQPRTARQLYSKMYLHSSEEAFFVRGKPVTGLIGRDSSVALAICYELSVPEHAANAFENGAEIYVASVAEPVTAIEKALARLSEIAREYSMTVLMSNCVGRSDAFEWAGKTSVWNNSGALLSQLDDTSEGIIVVDTRTHDVVQRII